MSHRTTVTHPTRATTHIPWTRAQWIRWFIHEIIVPLLSILLRALLGPPHWRP